MSESAAGARGEGEGDGDGKVYLGSSGLQMKVGVTATLPPGAAPVRRHIWKPKPSADMPTPKPQLSPADVATPPAGTPAPRLLSAADFTPPPRRTLSPGNTPMPRARTPRPAPSLFGANRQPTLPPPAEPTVQGVHLAKGTLSGLCLLMFSLGVITTVLVDRYWPTRKAEWAGSVPSQAQPPAPVAEAVPPAPAAAAGATTTDSPSSPPAVEPMPVDDVPGPLEAKPAPAAGVAPAATPEPSRAPVNRPAPAQGRGPAHKRPATGRAGSSPGGDRTMAPTGTWVDPFE